MVKLTFSMITRFIHRKLSDTVKMLKRKYVPLRTIKFCFTENSLLSCHSFHEYTLSTLPDISNNKLTVVVLNATKIFICKDQRSL